MSDDLGSASAQLIDLGPPPELKPLRAHMTVAEYEALVSMLERRCARYRHALLVIAGIEQCIDPTWSDQTVASVALQECDDDAESK